MTRTPDITAHPSHLAPQTRASALGQLGGGVWLTGLSASGKSTLAMALERRLVQGGHPAYTLDGDNLRHGLCAGLGFSPEDRRENIRRAGHVLQLMARAGLVAIGAFISPEPASRAGVRALFDTPELGGRFIEVYVSTPLAVCEARDPKGLYRRARAGEIPQFTGISAPYEPPGSPELTLDLSGGDVEAAVDIVIARLRRAHILPMDSAILPGQ